MNEHLIETVQNVASSKTALAIGVGTASVPAWLNFIHSDYMQAIVVVLGIVVSTTIVAINVQAFVNRVAQNKLKRKQERIHLALLEHQAREKGIYDE